MYSLKIVCGPDYPHRAPQVSFSTKIIMHGVSARDGAVDGGACSFFAPGAWQAKYTILHVLDEIRRQMCDKRNAKTPQPPDGAMF